MAHLPLSDTDFGKRLSRKFFVFAGQMGFFVIKAFVLLGMRRKGGRGGFRGKKIAPARCLDLHEKRLCSTP